MSIDPPKSLHYRVLGPQNRSTDHKPVVFLHGLMGFAANWGKIWPQFESERAVLVLDQRGHGKSTKPKGGYSPDHYAEDLAGVIRELGWDSCHIVGHSMGGRVALRFVSRFPELSASLTLEDSGMESNPKRVDWIKALLAKIPTPFADREQAKKFFLEHFSHDPMTGSFLHANLEAQADGTFDWRFYAPGMIETIETGRATDAMPEFRALTLPTLIVRGERSVEFPKSEAERMAESRTNVKLVEIAGAGHFVHAEKPQEFAAALKEFLADCERA